MHGRAALWAAAAALVAAAGCIGTVDGDVATAMEHRDVAGERAEAWSANATLVLAAANEPATPEAAAVAAEDAERQVDLSPADGQAATWIYRYEAPDREPVFEVAVEANGSVLRAQALDDGDPEGPLQLSVQAHPVEGWEVDSDEAAEAAWPDGLDRDGLEGTYTWLAGQDDADPLWYVGAEYENGTEHRRYVNATDGRVFDERPPEADPIFELEQAEGPPPEGGRFNGTVTPAEPTATHTFEVEEPGHPVLAVELAAEASSGATLNATVEGPEGEGFSLEQDTSAAGVGGTQQSIGGPSAGTWTVTVTLEEGLSERYRLDWCAGDTPPPVGPTSPADPRAPCEGAEA